MTERQIELIQKVYKNSKITKNGIGYIAIDFVDSLFTEKELSIFKEWITGQTCPFIDNNLAYYPWDVTRFIKNNI